MKLYRGDAPLPPSPIIIRWGTWINAALYYTENYIKIKEVFEALTPDAECIETEQNAIRDQSLLTYLLLIKTHFANLPASIKKLLEQHMKLAVTINIVAEFEKSLENVPGNYGINIREQLFVALSKNPVFIELRQIAANLRDPFAEHTDLSINQLFRTKYNFTPITTSEVERRFSA